MQTLTPPTDQRQEWSSRFHYVEYAIGGQHDRNHVTPIETFNPDRSRPDCFVSAYLYTRDLLEWRATHPNRYGRPSVRGYTGPARALYWYADFDAPGDLGSAVSESLRLIDYLKGYHGIDPHSLRIAFTGKKGIRIDLPTPLFDGDVPDPLIHERHKQLAEAFVKDCALTKLDLSIYSRLRLMRLINTSRTDSPHWCVPLTYEELRDRNHLEILMLANAPRAIPTNGVSYAPSASLATIWRSITEQPIPTRKQQPGESDEGHFVETTRNTSLTRIAGQLRRNNTDPTTALIHLQSANRQRCDPPLPETEVEAIFNSVWQYRAPQEQNSRTDTGNAQRLATLYGSEFRWVNKLRRWLIWDENRWTFDRELAVHSFAESSIDIIDQEIASLEATAELYGEGDDAKALYARARELRAWARLSRMDKQLEAMVKRAKNRVNVDPDQLDANPWIINCLNGTVNLKTGRLYPHRRDDLVTKLAPVNYDPTAPCPRWRQFLDEIAGPYASEITPYIQRAVGWSITGVVNQETIFFQHGAGANGKTTFNNLMRVMLGDYWAKVPISALMHKRLDGGVPNDIMLLRGARFVSCQETDRGSRFDESKLKDLTGRDSLSGRFLYGEFITFQPTHKLWIYGNYRPNVVGTDHGLWRRIHEIPYPVKFEPASKLPSEPSPFVQLRDHLLEDQLLEELSGIFAWAVEGCRLWQQDGMRLEAPPVVEASVQDYHTEIDKVGRFLSECCEFDPYYRVTLSQVFKAWRYWFEEEEGSKDAMLGRRNFNAELSRRFQRKDTAQGDVWIGVKLKNQWAALTQSFLANE